jgi:hypothetical protein
MVYSSRSTRYSNSRYSNEESGSGLWIISIVLIILIIIAIFAGTYYKRYEGFENQEDTPKQYTLQYYFMPNCGHCKVFDSNIWSILDNKVKMNSSKYKFNMIKYDITDDSIGAAKANEYNINSTPTIMLYNNKTKEKKEYTDDRTEKDLLNFVDKNIDN